MEENKFLSEDIVHIARLALSGRPQDVQRFLRQLTKKYKPILPEVSDGFIQLLREAPIRSSPLRKEAGTSMPVDLDSRLDLLRCETVLELGGEPIFADSIRESLHQIVEERKNQGSLLKEGLTPTRSILFTGAPGVGKSLAARWLARELKLPLLILDLSAVMSSYLGRTGNNIRYVLDYAKSTESILLLDELDAIAKRRDDATEIGELKRLVTVLLQEIDDWPSEGLLVAATNHPSLLDPAVWRRFELNVEFPMPDSTAVHNALVQFLGPLAEKSKPWMEILSSLFQDMSFSDIEREINLLRRSIALNNRPLEDHLMKLVQRKIEGVPRSKRAEIATSLVKGGQISQRFAHEITGVSRDTIRKKALAEKTETER